MPFAMIVEVALTGLVQVGCRNGTFEPAPGEARPLALFTAPRVDYSLHRLRHYTGTDPEHFQNFVLFTNYQFYIDEFVRLGHEAMADPASEYLAFVEPGNVITRRTGTAHRPGDELGSIPPRLPQMPAYHLVREDGAGLRPVRSRLTSREWEVLDLLCEQLSTDEIADTLVLSPETVRSHIKNLLRKLGVRSRREAVEQARRLRSQMITVERPAA